MVTGYVDPNGDVSKQWELPASGTHFDDIDDGVRQPTAPGTSTYIAETTEEAEVQKDVFNMTSLAGVSEVTQIKVWAYGHADGAASPSCKTRIKIGGVWKTLTNLNFTGSNTWKSATFTGSWTQAQLDALQVELEADLDGDMGEVYVYEMYCEVTYTPTAGVSIPVVMHHLRVLRET